MSEWVSVRFLRDLHDYRKGQVASFAPGDAERLRSMGLVEPYVAPAVESAPVEAQAVPAPPPVADSPAAEPLETDDRAGARLRRRRTTE